ncbi:regulator of chromosome condensation [Anaeramoeba ignava]|uniref:Regulator of chromosome condensation n=1 Tax=Anaeramoeba ignava TaxID=1746090 RepID=A0A9Q0L7Y3_ANAIG|nr:regulator of chromosome condensation [Anaeramoeba ignava]
MQDEVWFWGSPQGFSSNGALTPKKVFYSHEFGVQSLSSGNNNIIIIQKNGKALQIKNQKEEEIQIDCKIIMASVSYNGYLLLTENGEVYSNGNLQDEESNEKVKKIFDPKIQKEKIIKVVCGVYQTYMLSENGNVYGYGRNSQHQFGLDKPSVCNSPVLIKSDVKNIFAGNYAYCLWMLMNNNKLFVSGFNRTFSLGIGDIKDEVFNHPVENIPKGEIIKIITGFEQSIMLVKNNGKSQIYGCGDYAFNGLGLDTHQKFFAHIDSLQDEDIIDVDSGCFHTLVLTRSNKLFVFGINSSGQLGSNNYDSATKPIQIHIPELVHELQYCRVSAGAFNSFLYFSSSSSLDLDLLNFLDNQEACDIQINTIDGKIGCHYLLLKHVIGENNISNLKQVLNQLNTQEAMNVLKYLYAKIYLNEDLQEKLRKLEMTDFLFDVKFSLKENFLKMRNDEESKDFIIKSDSENIKVHKLVLWARSELFRGMFLSVINDDSNQVSDYSGLSLISLKILIDYLYLDEIEEKYYQFINENVIEDLSKAMDYFQLNENEPNLETKVNKIFLEQKQKQN